MLSHCTHRIEITNLNDGETITHEYLLIKGCIDNHHGDLHDCVLSWGHDDQTPQSVLKSPLSRDGKFKFLVDLGRAVEEGTKPTFRFCYCNAHKCLQVVCKKRCTEYKIQPLYILCPGEHDKEEDNACRVIDLNLRLIQCTYAEKIREAGFGRCTFTLNGGCELFRTDLTCKEIWRRTENELWQYFAKEVLASDWGLNNNLKFVAFISCNEYDGASVLASGDLSYENIRRHLKGHAALGGGGLALFSSAYFYSWPSYFNEILDCFRNEATVDPRCFPEDSNYRRTFGGVYASTLGAVCHEMGHIFDLGHTKDGIMGSGFDYINRVYTLDVLTEHLPMRTVQRKLLENSKADSLRPRITQFGSASKGFLEKYREQKMNDSFYFTRNCAVILAQHKWLRQNTPPNHCDGDGEFDVIYNESEHLIKSHTFPLKAIEIRTSVNSLVMHSLEFQKNSTEPPIFSYSLRKFVTHLNQKNYIFVLSTCGHTKKLVL